MNTVNANFRQMASKATAISFNTSEKLFRPQIKYNHVRGHQQNHITYAVLREVVNRTDAFTNFLINVHHSHDKQ